MKNLINSPTPLQMCVAVVLYLVANTQLSELTINRPVNGWIQLAAVLGWVASTVLLIKMAYNLITKNENEN